MSLKSKRAAESKQQAWEAMDNETMYKLSGPKGRRKAIRAIIKKRRQLKALLMGSTS